MQPTLAQVTTAIHRPTGRECVTCPYCKSIILLLVNSFLVTCPNPTCKAELYVSTGTFQREVGP